MYTCIYIQCVCIYIYIYVHIDVKSIFICVCMYLCIYVQAFLRRGVQGLGLLQRAFAISIKNDSNNM